MDMLSELNKFCEIYAQHHALNWDESSEETIAAKKELNSKKGKFTVPYNPLHSKPYVVPHAYPDGSSIHKVHRDFFHKLVKSDDISRPTADWIEMILREDEARDKVIKLGDRTKPISKGSKKAVGLCFFVLEQLGYEFDYYKGFERVNKGVQTRFDCIFSEYWVSKNNDLVLSVYHNFQPYETVEPRFVSIWNPDKAALKFQHKEISARIGLFEVQNVDLIAAQGKFEKDSVKYYQYKNTGSLFYADSNNEDEYRAARKKYVVDHLNNG